MWFVEKLGGVDEGLIGVDAYTKRILDRKYRYKTVFQVISPSSREVEFVINPAWVYWENFWKQNNLKKSKTNLLKAETHEFCFPIILKSINLKTNEFPP